MAHLTELFLDDQLIEMAASVVRTIQRPSKHPQNPVIHSDRWWEGNLNLPFATLYDEEEKCFKMWMRSGWDGAGADEKVIDDHHSFTTYLTSSDGVHWEKPELRVVDFGGRRDHNVVYDGDRNEEFGNMARQGRKGFIQNVARHPNPKDENEKYVALAYNMGPRRGVYLGYSPDGIRWQFAEEPFWRTPLDCAPWGDDHQTQLIFDQDRREWVIYRRVIPQESERMIGNAADRDLPRVDRYFRIWARAESNDLRELSNYRTVLSMDADDPPDTELYNLICYKYEKVYIAYLGVSRFRPGAYYLDVELATSRNGVDFTRVCRGKRFIPAGPHGYYKNSWVDYDVMQGWQEKPIIVDDTVYIYYKGFNRQHGQASSACAPYEGAAVGLVTFKRDRFVGLKTGPPGPCRLVTKPFILEHPKLYLNAATWGEGAIRVEVLTRDWQAIPGFGEAESSEVRGNALAHRVRWTDRADLGELIGKEVRLKFCMKDARIHAITLSTDDLKPRYVSDPDPHEAAWEPPREMVGAIDGQV